jgi:dihydroxyacetone kinase-like predicted kinase
MPSSPAAERMYQRYEAIDGHDLRKGISAGLAWLRTHQQVVNALNVFPVPDGDTGTNMLLTMQAAWKEVEAQDNPNIGFVAHAVAHGALMGARGNSGVILSQLWRGFARQLDGVGEMGVELLVKSLDEARRTAYKGVVRPVEGTILTVSKDIAEAAQIGFDEGVRNPLDLLRLVVEAAHASVARTPDLLPVLKDAGVVDSGGKGLAYILEGMLRSAYRLPLDEPIQAVQPLSSLSLESCRRFPAQPTAGSGGFLRPTGSAGHLDPGWRRRRNVPHAHPRARRHPVPPDRIPAGIGHRDQGRY